MTLTAMFDARPIFIDAQTLASRRALERLAQGSLSVIARGACRRFLQFDVLLGQVRLLSD
jgi:hypothetical protein